MRLISLNANHKSFKAVKFNASGLSLIVGRHVPGASKNIQKTYNGVGKSLIVTLVNYCLGANKISELEASLPGWAFTLAFEHAEVNYEVTRTIGETKFLVNGEEYAGAAYKRFLDALGVFEKPSEKIDSLTLRSLLCFFLRPRRASYSSYDYPEVYWKPYQSLVCQCFLLGLDYRRVAEKHKQKDLLDKQVEAAERYKKDEELREFYLGGKNADVELAELRGKISVLEEQLKSFRVAENYSDRQREADDVHRRISRIREDIVAYENAVADIDRSIKETPDVAPERVASLFEEMNVELPGLVTKRLKEVADFHKRLYENRRKRLNAERSDLVARISALNDSLASEKGSLNEHLRFLNAHLALDQYTENTRFLADLTSKAQRIEDYKLLLTQYTEEAQRVRVAMAQATLETNQYLRSIHRHTDMLMERFREYARELYGPVTAGLTVTNNDKENQIRYNIEAHIQNDSADGINDGKIFCYDFLLLTLQQRHKVSFLMHDSRLYADMDTNQRTSLFRLAHRVCKKMGLQYIATLNEDIYDSVMNTSEGEFQDAFKNSEVLQLTDAAEGRGKLLGIQIDMKFDE